MPGLRGRLFQLPECHLLHQLPRPDLPLQRPMLPRLPKQHLRECTNMLNLPHNMRHMHFFYKLPHLPHKLLPVEFDVRAQLPERVLLRTSLLCVWAELFQLSGYYLLAMRQ